MIVQKTSVFPASRKTIFEKLQKLETLQYIAKPFATFEPIGDTAAVWEEGGESSYRFRLFGIIPYGTHTIRIIRFETEKISSREGNEHVPVWNHDITLVSLDDEHTQYTDRVEIHAGWKTLFVWIWANLFYAHRQRRWIRLLDNPRMDDKQKSRSYFNRHSNTVINRNGYWSYDYRITSKILMRRNVKNLIDIGCGNGAFLALIHKASPGIKLTGPEFLRRFMNWWFTKWPTGDHAVYSRAEMEEMLRKAGFDHICSRLITPFTYACVGRKPGVY